jgi:DNA mismatch endonuclease (patch repair protein)
MDTLSPAARSALMSRVRGKGNRSTEAKVVAFLVRQGVRGWKRNRQDVPGQPDLYFESEKVAVFVDGCFWHGCSTCERRFPKTNAAFWRRKIERNKARDRSTARALRRLGIRVVRIWEHSLRNSRWCSRLLRFLRA